jgi:ABC-type multidrug transport system fused ATPase/permease subunit
VQQQVMTIGEFVAFYSYVGSLLGPISIFATLSMTISQGLAGAERIGKLMRIIPEIQERFL